MGIHKHLREEIIVDFALGNLIQEEERTVLQHIEDCPICKRKLEDWQVVLSTDKAKEDPHAHLKERIRRSFTEQRRGTSFFRPKVGYALIAGFATLFITLSMLALTNSRDEPMRLGDYAERETEEFRSRPDTKHLHIIPVSSDQGVSGNLWVNQVTNEMLLEVQGLTETVNRDHQLWIIYTDDEIEGKILPIQNGKIHMYMPNMNITHFKRIKASIEPKGGSLFPTGPETFFIEFTNLPLPNYPFNQ